MCKKQSAVPTLRYTKWTKYRAAHHTLVPIPNLKTFFNKTSINLYNTKQKDETKFYF